MLKPILPAAVIRLYAGSARAAVSCVDQAAGKRGAYMCENEAMSAHFRAAKNEKHP